jgi:hypothetical protein
MENCYFQKQNRIHSLLSKPMKLQKSIVIFGSILAISALAPMAARAQYILGSFQGSSDPTDVGWFDVNNGLSITNDSNASFVAAGVPGYPLSLQMSGAGGFGTPSQLELQFSSTQIAAFNANSWLTFTFSVAPGSATAGFNQIYNIAFNAPGYGYNNFMNGGNAAATWGTYSTAQGLTSFNQSGEPNFYFFSGDAALDTETVSVNYSSILPAIEAGGESYLQITFQGNTGGGSPAIQDFNQIELSTQPVPEPGTLALAGLGGIMGMFTIRRWKR